MKTGRKQEIYLRKKGKVKAEAKVKVKTGLNGVEFMVSETFHIVNNSEKETIPWDMYAWEIQAHNVIQPLALIPTDSSSTLYWMH